jgi:NAD(P)-dependent dehydrogenase (short-subunit alcohol dehydrogenase family)
VTGSPEPRRALVTGGAAGIGAAIADRLRSDGLEVTTLDRAEGCDLRLDLVADQLPDLRGIDVCVSNAAITDTIAPAHRMTEEQWAGDIEVNLTGAFRAVKACLAGMRERRWGRVVVISSGGAVGGLPGQVAYAASKAGLLGMVKTLAAEGVRRGITANAILPGMVATEKVLAMPKEVLDRIRENLPAGRMAAPSEVAALVSYLASEDAAYVTGQAIGIDGGAALNTITLGSQQRPD